MKKIFCLVIFLTFLICNTAFSNTYDFILNENGALEFKDNYISKNQLKEVIKKVFAKESKYNLEDVGHATGYDFFSVMADFGYEDYMVPNKEAYYNRALTPQSLYELLDFYFPYVSDIHNIDCHLGKLSRSHTGYLVTYGEGETYEFTEFDFFKVREELTDVWVIIKDEKIIDIRPEEREIPLSYIINKKEITGEIFLRYENAIIIETGGELMEFPTTEDFKILNKRGDRVVLIFGDYKYSKNLVTVAVGKDD